jgi:hypothetical protein
MRSQQEKPRSWPSLNPVDGPRHEVLYRDERGSFHLLRAWPNCHTSLRRLSGKEAAAWLLANGHPLPRELASEEGPMDAISRLGSRIGYRRV